MDAISASQALVQKWFIQGCMMINSIPITAQHERDPHLFESSLSVFDKEKLFSLKRFKKLSFYRR